MAADQDATRRSNIPQPPRVARQPFDARTLLSRVLLGGAMVLGGWTAYQGWQRVTAPPPPEIELGHVELPVAEAIQAARQRVREHPHSAAMWGELAMVLMAHSFLADSQSCLAQAERLAPRDPRWSYLRGCCGMMLGSDDTVACLQRAVERADGEVVLRLRLGEALFERGRVEEAEHVFQAVLAVESNNPRAHLGMGRVKHAHHDLSGSLQHLLRAEAQVPQMRAIHVLLAEVYDRLGDRINAEDQRRRIAELKAELLWPDPYLQQVEARSVGYTVLARKAGHLRDSGLFDEGEALLRKLVADHPQAAKARFELGKYLVIGDQGSSAEPELRQALALEPDLALAHYYLGGALTLQKRYAEAVPSFRRAIEFEPGFASAHSDLGLCLMLLGDTDGAIAAFAQAVQHKPDHAVAHKHLGLLLAARGDDAQAVSHLTRALSLDPSDADVRRQVERLSRAIEQDR